MIGAVAIMLFVLKITVNNSWRFTGYITAAAFLEAEFAASFEWQIHCYILAHIPFFQNNSIFAQKILPTVFMALIYAVIFFITFTVFKMNKKAVIKNISFKEFINSILIAIIAFALGNMSFVSSTLPFTSSYIQEIFIIRTLMDFIGIALIYSYQTRIVELKLKTELESMQNIMNLQYQNFLNFKESIDVINIKYHDLKHQVAALKSENDPVKREAWIDSLMQELELYNINFDTGNKVLDTILSTKELQCKKYGINITFLVNGKPLSFMSDSDIVSLFSNALDNAIEAVSKISNKDKRLIHLEVSEKKQFLIIRCENYTEEIPEMNHGELVTSKKDKVHHGFGVKSIKFTVKKYGGNTNLSIKNSWACLDILIPFPGTQ